MKEQYVMECTLCQSKALEPVLSQVYSGKSWQCSQCDLIFKNPEDYWGWEKQKQRYEFHHNSSEDTGYLQYFEQLLKPLGPFLKNIEQGLDWGSGPEPVLKKLLEQKNVKMNIYDPIYQSDEKVLQSQYSLITCTEVAEHFTNPQQSFTAINSCLQENAIFAGMTQFHQGPDHYANWWYVKDPTHVSFYSEKTMQWLSRWLNWKILKLDSPVFIFQKEVL